MKDENVQRQQKAAEVADVEPLPEEGICKLSTANILTREFADCNIAHK